MLLGIRHDIHLLSGFYVLYGGFKYFDMIFIRIFLNKIIKNPHESTDAEGGIWPHFEKKI
jgi:menaquinone-dependent protoporphyrinogen IX oxidase